MTVDRDSMDILVNCMQVTRHHERQMLGDKAPNDELTYYMPDMATLRQAANAVGRVPRSAEVFYGFGFASFSYRGVKFMSRDGRSE